MEAACKKKRTNLNAFFKRYTPNAKDMTSAGLDATPELLTSDTTQSAPLPTPRVGSLADEMVQPPVHLGYLDQEDLEHLETVEAQRQRKSPNANLKPVWKYFIRLPEHLRPRYCRTLGSSKALYDDKYAYNWCCRHCRQLIVVGCTKWLKQEPGIVARPRVPEPKGCWQTTRCNDHLAVCPAAVIEIKQEALGILEQARTDAKLTQMKQVARTRIPMVQADGRVVFGAGLLKTDPQMDALHSIARLVINCNHPLPDSFVEDPLVTLAGYCVHSTVVPAIVPKIFLAPSEEIHGKELLFSNDGGCYK
jgi:hypothetical protein